MKIDIVTGETVLAIFADANPIVLNKLIPGKFLRFIGIDTS